MRMEGEGGACPLRQAPDLTAIVGPHQAGYSRSVRLMRGGARRIIGESS
jgi:hypothetical protein